MKNITLPPVLTLLLTLAFAFAPLITPPFMGYDPGLFPVEVTRPEIQPAGYAFAIWGVIYLWLIVSAGFGLWRRAAAPAWQAPRWPLIGALALGTLWLWIAAGWPLTATAVILVMAALAITAFLRADPAQDRWLLSAPLGLFAGWLTAASSVSVGVMLAGYGILSNSATALVMLVAALAVALAVQRRRPRGWTYGLAVTWAVLGIVVANWALTPLVAWAAVAGAALMAAATGLLARRT